MIVLNVFLTIVSPVCVVVLLGMAVRYWMRLPVVPLNRIALYIFVPALVFLGMATTDLPMEQMGKIVLFAVTLILIMWGLSYAVSKGLRLDPTTQGTFILASVFMNSGNLPLPIINLAFGPEVLDRGLVFFTTQAVLVATLGVFVISRGHSDIRGSLQSIIKMPLPYAAILGLAVNFSNTAIPTPLLHLAELLSGAAFPTMLVVLGFQLVDQSTLSQWRLALIATGLRIGVGLALGFALMELFNMDHLSRNALLIQSAAPTAVIVTILATEFNSKPSLATAVVLISTIFSLPALTGLISFLV